ncbi:hypothetical protein [Microbacterium invictum]|uniref:Uncharacterized protein n=1 Tax=Microbacterium invictum TaxID=515415 RepID=A0ABZ0VAH7_9MICO|nr:hypothetical protein [Microbacterium invictum]WQB70633.1 hypothetical protein T9R20_01345 [Microbacterium invictum]
MGIDADEDAGDDARALAPPRLTDEARPTFDRVLHGSAPVPVRTHPGRRLRGDGCSSGRFVVGLLCAGAILSAAAAAVSLALSVRDDEAALLVGFGVFLQILALALLIGAALSVLRVDGLRWPAALAVAATGTLAAGILLCAYRAVEEGWRYIP